MNNGHLGKCKTCTKKDVAKHRIKNRDRIMEYDRKRSKLYYRKKLAKKILAKWIKEHPKARHAQNKVNNAIRDGKLLKPEKCSHCNKVVRLEGHHPDYRKPLWVIWLCNLCHKIEHGRAKNVSNVFSTTFA